MEMASAHGLALKLVEMSRLDRINRNELCEIISEEDKVIKLWFTASNQPRFYKLEFFNLTRRTLLFILSHSSLKEVKKKELLKGVSIYFNNFSSMLKNNLDIRRPLIDVIVDPWKNTFFSWEELFQKRINISNSKVQQFFCSEPEEIVLARVHFFSKQGKDDMSMILAKNSFLFHSRVAKHLSHSEPKVTDPPFHDSMPRKGTASLDWYLHNLRRKKNLTSIYNELKQLTCHEGVLLVMRLRQNKLISFAFSIVQLFLMQELVQPSKFCCTKKLFQLWCILHKEQKTSVEAISEEIRKIVAIYAPSSAHFYLLVDALWEQFGTSFINVYVELYIRGLTVDLNHLEAARNKDEQEDIIYLESHIASTFEKLSTLFIDFHDPAARECMFSAFSLKPTKDRLCVLQSLTCSILSNENEVKSNTSLNYSLGYSQECKCAVKCTGLCKSVKEHSLEHPILMKGIPNVPYAVVKDLVSVLENVRWTCFQYNTFDWHNNATDLGDYLRDFTLCKSWESDTECASDGSVKSEEEVAPANEPWFPSGKTTVDSLQPSTKRKSESSDMFFLDVGANIEVGNEDCLNKRIKIEDNKNAVVNTHDIFNIHPKPPHNFSSTLGMEDAIENVIRMTLDNNRQKSDISLESNHGPFANTSLSHLHDGTEKLSLSSAYKQAAENHVYPYSLTNYGQEKELNSDFKRTECSLPFKSDIENSIKYTYFPPKHSTLSQVLTSPISHESIISSTLNQQKNLNSVQEQSSKQMAQNKFLNVPNASFYRSKNIPSSSIYVERKVPVFQQEALNLESKNSVYEPVRNVTNSVSQSSQFVANQTTMQVLHKSDISKSDLSKPQFLPNTSNASSSSVASPLHLVQPRQTVSMQPSQYPISHHVSKSFKTDSRYRVVDNSTVSKTIVKRVNQRMCFQDNQLVHCDRSSVIQHTMQHIRENKTQIQVNEVEIPNQLAVSVNSDAAKQIRSVPDKDVTNLPPFTVNVTDRSISNSSLAVSANLVIARKPQPQIEVSSKPLCSENTAVRSTDTITIPGILASPSVIVSPWEAQRKVHGEMMYKKNTHALTTSAADKRIYRHRPPLGKQLVYKPQPKMVQQRVTNDKNNTQVYKTVTPPSHINTSFRAISPANQSNVASTSQTWALGNKSSSSQTVSQSSTSQPWYSEPYPKPYNRNYIPSSSSGSSGSRAGKHPQSTVKVVHLPDAKTLNMYATKAHLSQSAVIPTVAQTSTHLLNSTVSSSAKSSVLNVNSFSLLNPTTSSVTSNSLLLKDYIPSSLSSFQSNNMANIKTYSTVHKPIKNNSSESTVQLADRLQFSTDLTLDKNSVAYTVPDVTNTNLHYSHASSRMFPSSCCSPSEVNPCQNCSLPSENNLVQSSGEKNSDDHPTDTNPSSNKMVLKNDLMTAAPVNSKFSSNKDGDGLMNRNTAISNCQYCSQPILKTELQIHILSCSSRVNCLPGVKCSLVNEIDSSILMQENLCTKSLPDVVPEQDSLFQKEPFHSDLPHSKSFVTTDDEKNLSEIIDANALNACLDLINNDKDLKRIVQGIDSLNQIGNNYLPYVPPTNSDNFLNDNLYSEIEKSACQASLQSVVVSDKNDEFDNYAANCGPPQLQEGELVVEKPFSSVFEFTEKEYESSKSAQKLILPKPDTSYTEKISDSTPKTSNELTFSAIAEMIKETITENCQNEIESIQSALKANDQVIIPPVENLQNIESRKFSCPYCFKQLCSAVSVKRHIFKLHPNLSLNEHENKLSPKLTDMTDSCNQPDDNFQFKNDVNSGSGNSYNDSSNSLNHVLYPDDQHNFTMPNVFEMGSVLPKGRIKGIIKSPTTKCKICGKTLTVIYLKKHILNVHKEIITKTENSSSDLNIEVNQSLASPVNHVNTPEVPSLLEQDIDSSTCLSVSDALKRTTSYTVAETSHYSEESGKVTENTDVKFNFNVLEFSKDTKIDPKVLTSDGHPSENLENPPSKNVSSFEAKNMISNITYSKQSKCVERRQSCPMCNKSYMSVTSLNRHLKTIHSVLTAKAPKQNKTMNTLTEAENIQIEENKLLSYTNFHKGTDANVETLCISNKKTTYVEKVSHDARSFIQSTKERCRNSITPNLKKSLLKAVLQSNFVKDNKETRDVSEMDGLVHNEQNNFCNTLSMLKSDPRMSHESTSAPNESLATKDLESSKEDILDPGLNSFKVFSASVPSENLKETCTIANPEEPYLLTPSTNVHNHPSVSTKLLDSLLKNEMPGTSVNSDIKYSNLADLQNSSIQSNEISPISEIISNVSGCHFGGTSNNDIEKEVFEDNSLKLLIPENKDESTSNVNYDHNKMNKSQSNIDEQNKVNVQSDICDEDSKVTDNQCMLSEHNKINDSLYNLYDEDGFYNLYDDGDDVNDSQNNLYNEHDLKEVQDNCGNDYDDQNIQNSCDLNVKQPQDILLEKEKNCISGESDLSFKKMLEMNSENSMSSEEGLENDSCELENTSHSSDKNYIRCRLCDQNLDSMELLSKHLKDVHNIPVLKKHVSQPISPENLAYPQEIVKLSPPKLKLGTHESDSESVSDFDNHHNWSKIENESLEKDLSNNETFSEDNLHPLSQQVEQGYGTPLHNLPCELKKNHNSVKCTEDAKPSDCDSSILQSSKCSDPNAECHQKISASTKCKYKFKRNSFDGTCLDSPEQHNLSDQKSGHLSFEVKNNFCKRLKKSSSLTNIKITLQSINTTCIEHQLNNTKPYAEEDKIESSSGENNISDRHIESSGEGTSSEHIESSGDGTSNEHIESSGDGTSNEHIEPSFEGNTTDKYSKSSSFEDAFSSYVTDKTEPSGSSHDSLSSQNNFPDSNSMLPDQESSSASENTEEKKTYGNFRSTLLKGPKLLIQKAEGKVWEMEKETTKEVKIEMEKETEKDIKKETEEEVEKETEKEIEIEMEKETEKELKMEIEMEKEMEFEMEKEEKETVKGMEIKMEKEIELEMEKEVEEETEKQIKIGVEKELGERSKKKSKYFSCHKKFKGKRTYKPIILTLKEATEVDKFLETHKQPIVKLIRLKENEFNYLYQESDHTSNVSDQYNIKEAVVKLERIHIPGDNDKVNKDLFVPNLLSQDTHSSSESMEIVDDENVNSRNSFYTDSSHRGIMEIVDDKNSQNSFYTNSSHVGNMEIVDDQKVKSQNSFYTTSRRRGISSKASRAHNPPEDIIDLESCSSSDSIEFLGTVSQEDKCELRADEFCSMPSTKKCFVVLNRISV